MHLNDDLVTRVQQLSAEGYRLLEKGQIDACRKIALKLLSLDPDDINVCNSASGLMIDIGLTLRDISLVDQGIKILEQLLLDLADRSENSKIQFRYNLSNGYSARHQLQIDSGRADEAAQSLQDQKRLLQLILVGREHLPPELAPSVTTNYANLLDHLNRTFEAVDQFFDCLSLAPDHGLARGNCAAAVRRVIFLSEQHCSSNLHTSWELSSKAIEEPSNIAKWSSPAAVEHLRTEHAKLRSEIASGQLGGMARLENFIRHREIDHPKELPPGWTEPVRHDRLFLSFNQQPRRSAHEAWDDAFFDGLFIGNSEKKKGRSVELINQFNAIKEAFVTARYLYYQTVENRSVLVERNQITLFGEPEGDTEFGLVSGVLKASFRGTIDLLDKIAVFLARYLNIGDSSLHFSFSNVWYKRKGSHEGELHPHIRKTIEHDNFPLMGLLDLHQDIRRQAFPGPVKNARNATVHRWLRLSWLPVDKGGRDGASWNLQDFSSLTFFMLRQSKAAILMLAAAVNLEERRRRSSLSQSDKIFIPTPLLIRRPISARASEDLESSSEGRDEGAESFDESKRESSLPSSRKVED